jgi:hypothetical protein
LSGSGATGTLTATGPNFDSQPYYYGSQGRNADVVDNSAAAVTATSAEITGADAAFFSIDYNGCSFTLNPGNGCSVGVRFNPTGPGSKTAQLELTNDGTSSPLVIPLSATALTGPATALFPTAHDFGPIAVGSGSSPQPLTITNTGDFPLQVQQLLMLSGTPQLFAVSADSCTQQRVNPGSSCQLSVTFNPARPGERSAAVYIISDAGPVATIPLTGIGTLAPNGVATITGDVTVGTTVACVPQGYPEGTSFAYSWLRNGAPIAGDDETLALTDADVGVRLVCQIAATNAVGVTTATSSPTVAARPRDLSRLDGSLVDAGSCRTIQVPRTLVAAGATITINAGTPITPWAGLVLTWPRRALTVWIDNATIGTATGKLSITPRALEPFLDGVHTLRVAAGPATVVTPFGLAPCRLAVRFDGGPRRASHVNLSSAVGMSDPTFRLPGTLRLRPRRGRVGLVAIRTAGRPTQTFELFGRRTASNGITINLTSSGISVTGLPSETGLVQITLAAGLIRGHAGRVHTSALLRGDTVRSGSTSPVIWRA